MTILKSKSSELGLVLYKLRAEGVLNLYDVVDVVYLWVIVIGLFFLSVLLLELILLLLELGRMGHGLRHLWCLLHVVCHWL